MLKLTDDLTTTWLLELWLRAPTPAKAARLRVSAVERLLKQYRIRRVNAEGVLRTLRQPAIKVSDGVAEAAGIHIHSLIVRLQVVNRELNGAERKLDELCTAIGETGAAPEERAEHRDVAILRSLPGIGRINLATLLSEASGPLSRRDYQAQDIVWRSTGDETQREVSCRSHALRFARSIAQHCLPLGTRCDSARSREPHSLCRTASTRALARTCHPRCRRQTPRSGMRPPATTDSV